MTKDFPAGLMFPAFGLTALYFGCHLAVGTVAVIGNMVVLTALCVIPFKLGLA